MIASHKMYYIAKCEQALGETKEVMRALEWETADGISSDEQKLCLYIFLVYLHTCHY